MSLSPAGYRITLPGIGVASIICASIRNNMKRKAESGSPRVEPMSGIHGLVPVVEALRAGRRQIEQITIAEGARHERLKELLELAKQARVPIHRVPRN